MINDDARLFFVIRKIIATVSMIFLMNVAEFDIINKSPKHPQSSTGFSINI
jgi:hypothetical protein